MIYQWFIALLLLSCCVSKLEACESTDLGDGGDGNGDGGGDGGDSGLQGLLGGDMGMEAYEGGATGEEIEDPSDLNCEEWDDECLWHNVGTDEDNIDWFKTTGDPDEDKMEEVFGTSELPDSPAIVAFPDEGLDDEDRAFLVSDPITCAENPEITFKHWISENAGLRVCQRLLGEIEPEDCVVMSRRDNPGPTTVELTDSDEPFEILFYADNFDSDKEIVMVDDVEFEADLCDGTEATTTTEAEPETDPTEPQEPEIDDTAACGLLNCNFDAGTECASEVSRGSRGWKLGRGQTGNKNTGIPYDADRNQQGQYAYLKGPHESREILALHEFELGEAKQLTFNWYKASYDAVFEALIDDSAVFTHDSTSRFSKQWERETITLPAGSHTLAFAGSNMLKHHYVAVDDMVLNDSSGGPFC